MKSKILIGALLVAFILVITGCEEKGPAEKAGEKIDNAVENVKDNSNDALEEAENAIEEAGDKIENETD
jgi:hyperosmotically inducible protein